MSSSVFLFLWFTNYGRSEENVTQRWPKDISRAKIARERAPAAPVFFEIQVLLVQMGLLSSECCKEMDSKPRIEKPPHRQRHGVVGASPSTSVRAPGGLLTPWSWRDTGACVESVDETKITGAFHFHGAAIECRFTVVFRGVHAISLKECGFFENASC